MITFDDVTKETIKQHNSNWQQIPDHQYRLLIFDLKALDLEKQIHYLI